MGARALAGALLVALALTAALTVAATALVGELRGGPSVDTVVAVSVVAIGAVVAAWYACTAALALVLRAARAVGVAAAGLEAVLGRAGAPLLRRAAVTGAHAGLGITLAVAPAVASPEGHPSPSPATTSSADVGVPGTGVPLDLGIPSTGAPLDLATAHAGAPHDLGTPDAAVPLDLATPDAAVPLDLGIPGAAPAGATHTPAASGTPGMPGTPSAADTPSAPHVPDTPSAPGPRDAPDAPAATYVVRAGDSLWAIAAAHLDPGADDDAVAAAWPRWYAANAAIIGPDPDHIHPGQILLAPTEENHR